MLDPTIISLGSGRLTFQVLYAIGVAMMAMAFLRRLPTGPLIATAVGWMVAGEWITGMFWDPAAGSASPIVALTMAPSFPPDLKSIYPVLPWLHVSKYPPSLAFTALELGLLCILMAIAIRIERKVAVRPNDPLLVFGQTAMFFYLAHRLVLEIPATYFGLRHFGGIGLTYAVSGVLRIALYPACRWYRGFKKEHATSWLRYF